MLKNKKFKVLVTMMVAVVVYFSFVASSYAYTHWVTVDTYERIDLYESGAAKICVYKESDYLDAGMRIKRKSGTAPYIITVYDNRGVKIVSSKRVTDTQWGMNLRGKGMWTVWVRYENDAPLNHFFDCWYIDIN